VCNRKIKCTIASLNAKTLTVVNLKGETDFLLRGKAELPRSFARQLTVTFFSLPRVNDTLFQPGEATQKLRRGNGIFTNLFQNKRYHHRLLHLLSTSEVFGKHRQHPPAPASKSSPTAKTTHHQRCPGPTQWHF